MYMPAELSIVAQFLQSECPMRWIQFRDGDFYLGDLEVKGEKFIADLGQLKLGHITRSENRIVAAREGRPLRSCFPHKAMPPAETATSFLQVVAEAQAISSAEAEPVVILGLEHFDLGVRVNFVADAAEGKAAVGSLCSLCARRSRNGAPIVKLTSNKYSAPSGSLGWEPQFKVVDWESKCGPLPWEDDIPF
jgi:hypothetical protein